MRARLGLAILALVAGCALAREASRAPANGTPAVEPSSRAAPPAPDVPFEGFWRWRLDTRFSWTILEVRAREDGEYALVCRSSGCTGPFEDETVGRREDGALVFDESWLGFGLHRLVPVRAGGKELLMPDVLPVGRQEGLAFERLSPAEAAAFPERWRGLVASRQQFLADIRRMLDERALSHPAGDAKR